MVTNAWGKKILLPLFCICVLSLCACDKKVVQTEINPSSQSAGGAEMTDDSKHNAKDDTKDKQKKDENKPKISVPTGFYSSDIEVELSYNIEGMKIYYTLDGSTPDADSAEYTSPIVIKAATNNRNILSAQQNVNPDGDFIPNYKVDKATVLRAIAIGEDGAASEEIMATYYIGLDKNKYEGLPVISLATDFDNLFDYEKGIYVLGKTYDEWLKEDPGNINLAGWQKKGNFSNRGKEWERYAAIDFLDADKETGFSQNAGIRIMGAASRSGMQKSFRIVSRQEYNKKNFTYELIPGNNRSDGNGEVEKYRTFVLRIGGNDRDYARFRDPYLQELVQNRNFDTYQTTPAIVFLNGEYWGLYTITEDYSKYYFQNNYGVDDNNVIYIKRGEIEDGKEEDIELFNEMFDFICLNDMSIEENYQKAAKMIDMDSLIDYVALNFYIYNQDDIFHGNNNWGMWRVREPEAGNPYADGRFRMAVYDLDYSTGIYDGGANYTTNNLREHLKLREIAEFDEADMSDVILSLLENEEFKAKLITVMCDMRNVEFEVDRAWALLAQYKDEYVKYMPDTIKRFGPFWAVEDAKGYYLSKVNELKGFMNGRYLKYPDLIKKTFDLENCVSVGITLNNPDFGTVKINTSTIDYQKKFTGNYFKEYPITLTALPEDGHNLVKWEYEGCDIIETKPNTITISLTGNCKIKAVFE